MRTIETDIDLFLENQLPSFYTNDISQYGGPVFIDFLRQYYRWLHSEDEI